MFLHLNNCKNKWLAKQELHITFRQTITSLKEISLINCKIMYSNAGS